jgi:polysaccharide deacetylase family protein (PEP-CTERM system associated)
MVSTDFDERELSSSHLKQAGTLKEQPSHGTERPVTHILSFDIEDWFHLIGIDAVADSSIWPTLPSLVVDYTRLIVDLVSEADARATFFVLGWVAERYPQLTRTISAAGHEIATHSYWHRRVDQHSPDEFRKDLQRSIDVLQEQTGKKVLGFRAPTFSITPGTEWAFDVMHDVGLAYDASLFPSPRAHGGYRCPQEAHLFTNVPSGRPILELPMNGAFKAGPALLPFSGGGYMRLLPQWLIRRGFDSFERKDIPVVVYLHPRDFAPECPRVPMPIIRRFKYNIGLSSTEAKLKMLLNNYAFDTCAAVLGLQPAIAQA